MVEKIFMLLMASPVLSIVLIFILIIVLSYLFKDVIKAYFKKKWGLYDKEEVREAVSSSIMQTTHDFTTKVSQNELENTIIDNLK